MKQKIVIYVILLLFAGMLYIKRDTPKVKSLVAYVKGIKSDKNKVQISIHSTGQIVVNGEEVTVKEVAPKVQQLQSQIYNQTQEDAKILMIIDKQTETGIVKDVEQELRNAYILELEYHVK